MKILLVDDDDLILDLLSGVLERAGYTADIRSDAGSAIATLKDDGSYDLVITDIVMPGEDGTELAKHVKQMEKEIPVIAITGGVENAVDDYKNYADMFTDETLSKPFKPDDLLEAVERVTN